MPRCRPSRDTVEPAQDRRRISVLLCELVETPALEALERDARHVVGDRFHTICHEAAGRLGGHVLPWVSDGVAIFFGHPLSRDDDALRAVRCGWEILRTLEAARAVVEREFGLRLATRVAIATGQAGEDDEAFGDVPRTAGAVQSGAAVDRVTVDAATRALAGAAFGFDARPGECFVVTGPAAAAPARGAAPPLVGRLGERALLHALAERAGAGTRTAVLIRGDAGIGKTRLVEHLAESARESLGMTVLGCACSPYHRGSALHALAPLAQRLGVAPADGTADAGAASPARRRREALAALADALEAEARQAPLLVVVEDLHWADPTTLELLWTLLDGPRELALMLVLTARSDFTAPPQRALQRMQLGRLDVPECRRVVEHVAAAGALASGATRRLAQQAGGSPLLATQLTLTALATQDAGARAPATLYGCLMARLDRDCTARDVARLAATIGPEFDRRLLDAVGTVEAAALDWGLERLVQEGVVAPTAPGHFAFCHSLLQEAARSSQRKRVLRTHNAAIARALLEHFPHVAAAEPERVARHFEYAGEVRHAVGHWQQAGRQALERHALREATTHFERAIELNARTPDGPRAPRRRALAAPARRGRDRRPLRPERARSARPPRPCRAAQRERRGDVGARRRPAAPLRPPPDAWDARPMRSAWRPACSRSPRRPATGSSWRAPNAPPAKRSSPADAMARRWATWRARSSSATARLPSATAPGPPPTPPSPRSPIGPWRLPAATIPRARATRSPSRPDCCATARIGRAGRSSTAPPRPRRGSVATMPTRCTRRRRRSRSPAPRSFTTSSPGRSP